MTSTTLEPIAYNIEEAAQASRVSPGMIRKLITGGALPASRIGDHVLFRPEALKALLGSER